MKSHHSPNYIGRSPPKELQARERVIRYPTARSALHTHLETVRSGEAPSTEEPARLEIKFQKSRGKSSAILSTIVARAFANAEPRTLVLKTRTSSAASAVPVPLRTGQAVNAASALGQTVRERRQSLSLTQQQLAERASVGRRFIVDLERGKPTLELGKVLTVTQALGLVLTASLVDGG